MVHQVSVKTLVPQKEATMAPPAVASFFSEPFSHQPSITFVCCR